MKTEFIAQKTNLPDSVQKPNIILIVADDLGKTDISLYGSELIQTPHMDALGRRASPSQKDMLLRRFVAHQEPVY